MYVFHSVVKVWHQMSFWLSLELVVSFQNKSTVMFKKRFKTRDKIRLCVLNILVYIREQNTERMSSESVEDKSNVTKIWLIT